MYVSIFLMSKLVHRTLSRSRSFQSRVSWKAAKFVSIISRLDKLKLYIVESRVYENEFRRFSAEIHSDNSCLPNERLSALSLCSAMTLATMCNLYVYFYAFTLYLEWIYIFSYI